jgi:hypothetical protein
MVYPMAVQPRRSASSMLPVMAEQAGCPLLMLSELLSFKMSGMAPA